MKAESFGHKIAICFNNLIINLVCRIIFPFDQTDIEKQIKETDNVRYEHIDQSKTSKQSKLTKNKHKHNTNASVSDAVLFFGFIFMSCNTIPSY